VQALIATFASVVLLLCGRLVLIGSPDMVVFITVGLVIGILIAGVHWPSVGCGRELVSCTLVRIDPALASAPDAPIMMG
jgi:hypothetical protein